MTRALFVCHEASEGPGLLGVELARRGFTVERCDVGVDPLPDATELDMIAVMGAPYSVHDTDPALRIPAELEWIQSAHRRRVPLLGVCFGAQAIAVALGGRVRRAPRPEIGWHRIQTREPWLAPGPWFQWHADRFSPPPGTAEIAHSTVASQAYVGERVLGVQFHPEVDEATVADWLDGRDAAEADFAAAGADPQAIVAAADAFVSANHASLRALVDHFLDDVATAV